ncbi:MAG: hypothetical protein INH41_13010 [Myxococcaceae bacterium]|jgi:hypothetical protein|nr:hypothetical protein [Myxococcaceae bacterium]MCA3013304.1 hypothetical protein [Myxococcaceae bacterium]
MTFPRASGATVALATKHGKERLVEGLLAPLGLALRHVGDVDTDQLGTFTRERPRQGTALDAARTKLAWAFAHAPTARFALASEGSFGPHPELPWVAGGHELVLLADRDTGLELRGDDLTADTNFAAATVDSLEAALAFAARAGFPAHALIVGAHKGVGDAATLERLVGEGLRAGPVALETDMRAHLNPLRQASIRRAMERCLAGLAATCPSCAWPGFTGGEPAPGLPCEACGAPTRLPRDVLRACRRCGHAVRLPVGATAAPAGRCDACNP